MQRKIIFKNPLCPGDLVMMLYGIKSLHESHPGKFLTDVRCAVPELMEHNPYITKLPDDGPGIETIDAHYPTINISNQYPVKFIEGYSKSFEEELGVKIRPSQFSGFLHLSENEKNFASAVYEKIDRNVPYWVINAGHKNDYPAKTWSFKRYQELIDRFPHVWFVQIGSTDHVHPPLSGHNLINMIGMTNVRQLIMLVYNSFGVISPVTFVMHLAYAVPPHPRFKRRSRASIVLAGGREPAVWEQGPNVQFLHTNGMLPCCDLGGCWKCRVVPLNDGSENDKSLCEFPVQMSDGQWIGKCMSIITVNDVARHIERYMAYLDYTPKY